MARVVVLDVDGTLMDTNYLHTEAWARAFERAGHRVPRVRLHKQIGKGAGLLIREFVDDEETEEKIQNLHSEYLRGAAGVRPPASGGEGVDLLAQRTRLRGLVRHQRQRRRAGTPHARARSRSRAWTASSTPVPSRTRSRPPTSSRRPCGGPGRLPDETVAVGDAVWDVEAAREAGIRTVAVLSGGAYHKEALEEAGAVAVYEDCAALLDSDFPE